MNAQSVSILANTPAPSYSVRIPTEQMLWYQFAAPLFLTLAIVSFGLWLTRSRGLRRGTDRAMLLACVGCLWLSYTAWWIWQNRDGSWARGLAAAVAAEMPVLWILFCMLAFVMTRYYLHDAQKSESDADKRGPKLSPARTHTLAGLLGAGTIIPVAVVGDHGLFLPFLSSCWIFAFVVWLVIGLVAWLLDRTADQPTSTAAQADPVTSAERRIGN